MNNFAPARASWKTAVYETLSLVLNTRALYTANPFRASSIVDFEGERYSSGSRLAKKFYVVWRGLNTGIFSDWESCRQQVDKFPGARFKSFASRAEAEEAFGKSALTAPASAKSAEAATRGTSRGTGKSASRATNRKTIKTYSAAEVDALQVDTKIFTDGGCEPNPGQAGSGMAVYREQKLEELWHGLYNPAGTNNTAELNALHQAMLVAARESADGRAVAIFCDSKYSIQCVTEWAVGWQKKGWKRPGGQIKNLALIKEMFALYQTLSDAVQVLHVNGHVGVQGNELADRMTMQAIESRELEFVRYSQALDVEAILRMRAG